MKVKQQLSLFLFWVCISGYSQTSTKNKDLGIYYFQEVVNKKNVALLDHVFSKTFISHNLTANTQESVTIDKHKEWLLYLFKAFPDIKYTISDVTVEQNKVVMRAVFSGTHQGEFLGYQPNGKHIDYLSEIFFFRLEEGKIAETWVQIDWHNLFKKLAAKP